jgi:hypothetical protein
LGLPDYPPSGNPINSGSLFLEGIAAMKAQDIPGPKTAGEAELTYNCWAWQILFTKGKLEPKLIREKLHKQAKLGEKAVKHVNKLGHAAKVYLVVADIDDKLARPFGLSDK